jgi:hypothetical protein
MSLETATGRAASKPDLTFGVSSLRVQISHSGAAWTAVGQLRPGSHIGGYCSASGALGLPHGVTQRAGQLPTSCSRWVVGYLSPDSPLPGVVHLGHNRWRVFGTRRCFRGAKRPACDFAVPLR